MVRDGAIVGDMVMALFAFPLALKNPGRLFDYCHLLDGKLVDYLSLQLILLVERYQTRMVPLVPRLYSP